MNTAENELRRVCCIIRARERSFGLVFRPGSRGSARLGEMGGGGDSFEDQAYKIWVGGLPNDTNEDELAESFISNYDHQSFL